MQRMVGAIFKSGNVTTQQLQGLPSAAARVSKAGARVSRVPR
jgi:hypothetical protein